MDPQGVRAGDAVHDITFTNPGPDRLNSVPELLRDPLHRPLFGAQLLSQLPDEPHGLVLSPSVYLPRRRLPWCLFFRHDSILVSKTWSLQGTQGDSKTATWGERQPTTQPDDTRRKGAKVDRR